MAALFFCAPELALAQQPRAAALAQGAPRSVTLITGDRVLVSGLDAEFVSIQREAGRERMRFMTQRTPISRGGRPHLFVIPEDALPLLQSGKLDRRLFDVTLLIQFAYDDAHRQDLPLIVTYERGSAGLRAVGPRVVNGAVTVGNLPSVNGLSVTSPKAQLNGVWRSFLARPASGASARALANEPIDAIWLDGLLYPVLDHSVPQIGAPAAWALGYEGDGVVVAVLDTGVDDTHPDLIDSVVVSKNFTTTSDLDEVGHGTHVASIIAGSGRAEGGRYRGVAPGVQLLSGKVCEEFGCEESSIILGMQWAVAEEGAEVVNLSLGELDVAGSDPLVEAVNSLSAEYGALFVIAAGNSGPDPGSVESPGSAAAALTVGAVDRNDDIAFFSSRGMTVDGAAIKPDLTAPGVDIVAARAAGTELGTLVGQYYVQLSGTSMATPHAAGAAALIFQQHPTWRPADVKAALMGSAAFNPGYSALDQGSGRVDIAAALGTSFLANVSSVSFGVAQWPHEDDEPITRSINYRNLGPATELVLELDVLGPDGAPPPEQMFTVTPSSITLAEAGTAGVKVTVDTRIPGSDGVYSGRLIASDGATRRLAIPIAVNREVESYDLVLQHIDRHGEPSASWSVNLFSYERSMFPLLQTPPAPEVSVRLPKGRYGVESFVFGDDLDAATTRLLAPNQLLDADRVLVLDASAALPVRWVAPQPGAENRFVNEAWQIDTADAIIGSSFYPEGTDEVAFYQAEIDPPAEQLRSVFNAQWLDTSSSPGDLYAGTWSERDHLPAGPFAIDLRDVAVVHASYAASLPSSQPVNELAVAAYLPTMIVYSIASTPVELPAQRTEYYYSNDPDVRWINELWMHDEEYAQSITIGNVSFEYRAGQSYATRWNQPMFSPALAQSGAVFDWAYRTDDSLVLELPMYSDRAGHAGFISNEGTTRLYREGELVGESVSGSGGSFEVPPEAASYRLELDHHQSLFELTPHQQVAWTFQSEHGAGTARLPLLVVRFDPALNDRGRAPNDARFCLPLTVERLDRVTPSDVSKPNLEVSYDDGVTWLEAAVEAAGAGYEAFLDHPKRAGYVSLRSSAHDARGNSVEQTIYRAYGLEKQR